MYDLFLEIGWISRSIFSGIGIRWQARALCCLCKAAHQAALHKQHKAQAGAVDRAAALDGVHNVPEEVARGELRPLRNPAEDL